MSFDVEVADRDGVRIVAPRGELDVTTAPRLTSAVGAHEGPLVVDLTGVPFMSSAGLGAVSALRRRGPLALAGAYGDVLMLLEVTGLAANVPMADDVDGAVALAAEA
jgi:anti-sigma B factor antagonist